MGTTIVAEIGVNHNKDMELAKNMILSAKTSGADVVKFQSHIPKAEMIHNLADHVKIVPNLQKLIENVTFTFKDMKELKHYAYCHGLKFLSTPFSLEAVDELEEMKVDFYKVGSGEADNFLLLNRICETGRPIIVSTGVSTWAEVCETFRFLKKKEATFTLLQCVSEYPADVKNLHLRVMSHYKDMFKCPVGLSDHSLSPYPPMAAVALGATFIEKHFTTDRSLPGDDQDTSMMPDEFAQMVKGIRVIEEAMGSSDKDAFLVNADLKQVFRHGLVAKKDVKSGEIFTLDNLTAKRPLVGISSKYFEDVVGKKAKVFIKEDSPILKEYIDDRPVSS
tara:strand:+ start:1138 stop:2142 length:1005 start_codon:yes stop_codon:yes gene_type:complete